MTEQETRDKAKALGIKSWHLKTVENLNEEIDALENPAPALDPMTEKPIEVIEPKEGEFVRVLMVKPGLEGSFFREWTMPNKVQERLDSGWKLV